MKSRMYIPVLLLLSVLLILSAVGCGSSEAEPQEVSAGGLGGKTLVVAHDVNFPPFEFLKDDEYTGFDLDLLAVIEERANFVADRRPMDFNGIIPALQAEQVDLGIAAMTIKEEREEVIDFSIPYFKTGIVIAVKPETTDIETTEDLKGKTVAVKIGASGESLIRELPFADEIDIVTYDSNNDTYLAVQTGAADATVNDLSTLQFYISTEGDGKLKVVGDLLTGDDYGISVPSGHTETLQAINDALLELAEDGTYTEIYQKWFGEEPELIPGEY
ncbi:MAG: basic amino acid ABC transporter substrate-binding protein [Chloroflexota bacterium]|nr:MAG: basic amino acid ABC transporter substrate-binding protein [Chloroflexota bacterium]